MPDTTMCKYVVTATRCPTNYNDPVCYVVEAATEDDAKMLVKHQIRDLSDSYTHTYKVKPYVPPPAGRVLGLATSGF